MKAETKAQLEDKSTWGVIANMSETAIRYFLDQIEGEPRWQDSSLAQAHEFLTGALSKPEPVPEPRRRGRPPKYLGAEAEERRRLQNRERVRRFRAKQAL